MAAHLPKVAILDLYNNHPNQGLKSIENILYEKGFPFERFEVRYKDEIPDGSHDIYISTGGPGSPLDSVNETWEKHYFNLVDKLWNHNQKEERKKHIFFICHSFQMMARFFNLGEVCKRRSTSFGAFPVHKTERGKSDLLMQRLPDPFFVADFRDYQMVQPNDKHIAELGGNIVAMEKYRPHVDLERAVMAMRISPEFFGTQFHPEANPVSMSYYFSQPEMREKIIEEHGEEKLDYMISCFENPNTILKTFETVIPGFLDLSYDKLKPFYEPETVL